MQSYGKQDQRQMIYGPLAITAELLATSQQNKLKDTSEKTAESIDLLTQIVGIHLPHLRGET